MQGKLHLLLLHLVQLLVPVATRRGLVLPVPAARVTETRWIGWFWSRGMRVMD